MSTIKSFLSLLLRPMGALLVILFGVACMFASACIEVEVFKALLLAGGNAGQSLLIPMIIVGAFESFKVFLAYLKQHGSLLIPVWLQRAAYTFFVTVSFACTMIFTANGLFAAQQTAADRAALQSKLEALETEIMQVEMETFDPTQDAFLVPYYQAYDAARTAAEQHAGRRDEKTYVERASDALDALNTKMAERKAEVEAEKTHRLDQLEQQRSQVQSQLTYTDMDALKLNNNPMLDKFLSLLVLISGGDGGSGYDQRFYLFVGLCVALVISVGSELTIFVTARLLGAEDQELNKIFHAVENQNYSRLHNWVMATACGAGSVCLFVAVLQMFNINMNIDLVRVITALSIAPVLVRSDGASAAQSARSIKLFKGKFTIPQLSRQTNLTVLVSLALYCAIGFVKNGVDPSAASIPEAAAILVGAMGSRCFSAQ